MSDTFRELLKKVGSGVHTGEDLTREESEIATNMILLGEATPAQIGAFTIAHRIKRPTPEELAGMLDSYDKLGTNLSIGQLALPQKPVVFGNPYDGRSRTAPVTPITMLMLAAAGVPVIMHGGDCMPTKYGVPLVEIWQKLGVDFSRFSLDRVEQILEKTGIGFIYIPKHFPLAYQIVPYREQIGKRPPFATVELIWSPCVENVHIVAGFVHPPTEERFQDTFTLRGVNNFTTVKGLEGSCDLALSRTAIIGLGNAIALRAAPKAIEPSQEKENGFVFDRLHLNPRDYDLGGKDVSLDSIESLIQQLQNVLQGKSSELTRSAIFNGGFYLWRFGISKDFNSGFALAETMLTKGQVKDKLYQLQNYF
jgi:anthranilate phosphoribosyltransferase